MTERQLRVRTRNEGTRLRPYAGLEAISEALAESNLTVSYEFGEYTTRFGGQIQVPHRVVSRLGYRITVGNPTSMVLDAVQEAGIPANAVDLVVIAHDPGSSPLKESVLLVRRKLTDVIEDVSILGREDTKPRTMLNQHDGFDLDFSLVLNRALEPKPLRPRLKGTILASHRIAVQTTEISGGLQPNKLTNPIRDENQLPRESWIWTNEMDSLVNSNSLADVLAVYVDEEILRLVSLLPEDSRVLAEHVFTVPTLVQVILSASRELQQEDMRDFVFDGRNSSVLNLIYQKVKRAEGADMTLQRFTSLMRDDAARVVAYATSDRGTRKALRKALNNLIGDDDDVSEA